MKNGALIIIACLVSLLSLSILFVGGCDGDDDPSADSGPSDDDYNYDDDNEFDDDGAPDDDDSEGYDLLADINMIAVLQYYSGEESNGAIAFWNQQEWSFESPIAAEENPEYYGIAIDAEGRVVVAGGDDEGAFLLQRDDAGVWATLRPSFESADCAFYDFEFDAIGAAYLAMNCTTEDGWNGKVIRYDSGEWSEQEIPATADRAGFYGISLSNDGIVFAYGTRFSEDKGVGPYAVMYRDDAWSDVSDEFAGRDMIAADFSDDGIGLASTQDVTNEEVRQAYYWYEDGQWTIDEMEGMGATDLVLLDRNNAFIVEEEKLILIENGVRSFVTFDENIIDLSALAITNQKQVIIGARKVLANDDEENIDTVLLYQSGLHWITTTLDEQYDYAEVRAMIVTEEE